MGGGGAAHLAAVHGREELPPTQEAGNGGKEGVWEERAQRC